MANVRRIDADDLPKINPLISHAVAVGNLIVTGVEAGKRDDGTLGETVEEQMELAFKRLDDVLRAAGGDIKNAVRIEGFLSDVAYGKIFNEVYNKYFEGADVPPCRFNFQVTFANPKMYVEISAIAAI